jgi:hypothetical protein
MILTQMGQEFTRVEIPALTQYLPCNPSFAVYGFEYLATVRGCNYDLERGYHFTIGSAPSRTPDSQNYIAYFSRDMELRSYWFLEDRHLRKDERALDGIEDLRLFVHQGSPRVLGSALHYTPTPKNTMVLCWMDDDRLADPVFIKSPKAAAVEKNWMPLVRGNDLYFVYFVAPFELYKLDGDELKLVDKAPPLDGWSTDLSGSSCVCPYEDGYIAVIHNKTIDHRKRLHFYRHFLVLFDADMRPKKISRKFSFEEERVEFCSGLAIDGDNVVFSYGLMDQKAVILRMSKDSLRRLF